MKARFQADADLNQIIVKAILRREPTIDFQTAHAAKLNGLSDIEVLSLAAESGTQNDPGRKPMPRPFSDSTVC